MVRIFYFWGCEFIASPADSIQQVVVKATSLTDARRLLKSGMFRHRTRSQFRTLRSPELPQVLLADANPGMLVWRLSDDDSPWECSADAEAIEVSLAKRQR